ncbi:peptidyl-alpha-hydroxyglycine alpha-amidating lyase 1 isoform X1 [Ceratitis capitata]|uniref:peptidyl-alpha-hydroxyglycine alpha-amidating lyase 1 isoform X1 n=2 Tax=Ceratitis capitata TaxID=7213 RepID=UPI0003297C5C|nr:peptidyl-alpha-hydroxyglycine alpha-amidating lyase 1 isoform X1 [Ceratitis capitata]
MITSNFVRSTCCVSLVFLAICIADSATDENLSLQRYLSQDDTGLSTNKRIQQIMQGGGTADISWPQPPKLKAEKIDVKSEIAKLNTTYVYQSSWPGDELKLGSVSAVSFDREGNVVIFHRVDRIWDGQTFNNNNIFQQRRKGPIRDNTVLALERKTGQVVYGWGKGLFYMPHGLTIDHENNAWVTDVALHQVFKFGPRGSNDQPLLKLGTEFTPGAGDSKFCKPTSVAVLENGDFFIADGYCNARILKFDRNGKKILAWGQNSFAGTSFDVAPKNYFAIPHALTLVPEQQLVCAADRENGRVQCFFWTNGTFHSQYHNQIVGDRLFSMDYTPAEGGQLVVVNGPIGELGLKPDTYNEVRGYVINMRTKQVISKFGPNDMQFSNPHDVAVTKDGSEIYVAELNPMRIHKFLHKTLAKSMPMSEAKTPMAHHSVSGSTTVNTISRSGPAYQVDEVVVKSNGSISTLDALLAQETEQWSKAANKTHHPGGTAILVASLMLLFAALTFALALIIARRRKRGCLPFGVKNRRHAWDFPSKPDGFKLGGLLMDRSKRGGFEKLDQNASDEENEASTNMLTSAPFA